MTTETKVIITAQDRTGAAIRSARGGLRDLDTAAKSLRGALGAIGVGVSFAGLVTGLASAAKSAIEFGDEMQKAAARTGVSASRFALLAQAAKLSDIEVTALSTAFKKMQVAISEAGSGGKSQIETLKALGIEFTNLRQLQPEEQFELIADRISQLKDPADRVRASVELFGKAGADLLPFFEDGAKGIRAAREEVEKLGGALSDEEIQKLADADQAIKELSLTTRGWAASLTAEVIPAVLEFVRGIKEIGAETKGQTGFGMLWRRFAPNSGWTGGVGRASNRPLGTSPEVELANEQAMLRDALRSGPPGFTPAVKPPKGTKADTPAASLSQLYAYAFNDLDIQSRADTAEFFDQLKEEWKQVETYTKAAVEPISQMTVFAEEAARNMQSVFAQFLFDPFKEGLDGMLKGFVDVIRQMVAEAMAAEILRAFFSWAGGAVGGRAGSFISSLAPKAMGGPVSAGTPYMVGERGKEMFVPSTSGHIVPNHAMAGGVSLNYNIDARGADAERIMAIMPGLLKQTKTETIAEVRNLINRGRM